MPPRIALAAQAYLTSVSELGKAACSGSKRWTTTRIALAAQAYLTSVSELGKAACSGSKRWTTRRPTAT